MLIVYTWQRVILHAIDKSSIHKRSFANVVLGLAANESMEVYIMMMLFIPRSPNTVFEEGLPKCVECSVSVITIVSVREEENGSFPKHCKPR